VLPVQKKVIEALKRSRRVLVSMHVHPDPDAIGAALAMTLFLRSLGKDVRLYNEGPCPKPLAFMPRAALCRQWTEGARFKPDTAVILDCGDLDRIGKVKALIGSDTRVINIDHHVTNTCFAHLNLVNMKYSSTSEILYQLLKKAGCVLTRDIAVLLYLGILTDTGSFGFDCTTSHTHEVIADLLRFDISVSDLYRKVYETMPKEDLNAFFTAMSRMTLECGTRVACLVMTKKETQVFSDAFDLRDKIFGFLRAVNGLDVIVILTEMDDGRARINLRSRGKVNVARIAGNFNGGGHKNASGGYFKGTLDQARAAILAAIKKDL
jgi:phosphoesterase RecJ-like protein